MAHTRRNLGIVALASALGIAGLLIESYDALPLLQPVATPDLTLTEREIRAESNPRVVSDLPPLDEPVLAPPPTIKYVAPVRRARPSPRVAARAPTPPWLRAAVTVPVAPVNVAAVPADGPVGLVAPVPR